MTIKQLQTMVRAIDLDMETKVKEVNGYDGMMADRLQQLRICFIKYPLSPAHFEHQFSTLYEQVKA